jgi:two-component system chemotaxis response regulator CheB
VADVYKTHALVVIMTGMGQDGLLGCQRVKAEGGFVVIQDEASSVVWGMPGAIAKNNLEDKMLPLKAISEDLVNLVMQTRTKT